MILCHVPCWSYTGCQLTRGLSIRCCYIRMKNCMAPGYLCELVVPYAPRRVLKSAESKLQTVPPGKPGMDP